MMLVVSTQNAEQLIIQSKCGVESFRGLISLTLQWTNREMEPLNMERTSVIAALQSIPWSIRRKFAFFRRSLRITLIRGRMASCYTIEARIQPKAYCVLRHLYRLCMTTYTIMWRAAVHFLFPGRLGIVKYEHNSSARSTIQLAATTFLLCIPPKTAFVVAVMQWCIAAIPVSIWKEKAVKPKNILLLSIVCCSCLSITNAGLVHLKQL